MLGGHFGHCISQIATTVDSSDSDATSVGVGEDVTTAAVGVTEHET